MSGRAEKDALFEAIALMGKAFASPRRLELLDLLAQAPRTVDELARASGQSTANTSQHLQALHAAGMVDARRARARSVRYALAGDEALAPLAGAARRLGRAAGRGRARGARLPRRGRRGDRPRRADRAAAPRRRRARRRPPSRGVRGRPHRGRALDPARRARATARRAAGRPRGRRLLPRPVLRLRARGGPHACAPPAAPPAGSRTAGPSGARPRGSNEDEAA